MLKFPFDGAYLIAPVRDRVVPTVMTESSVSNPGDICHVFAPCFIVSFFIERLPTFILWLLVLGKK